MVGIRSRLVERITWINEIANKDTYVRQWGNAKESSVLPIEFEMRSRIPTMRWRWSSVICLASCRRSSF
jgi:hypothetical protein